MTIDFNDLYDSYGIKKWLDKLELNGDCRSALLFGPPGTGKSEMAKAIAQKNNLNYLKITPGDFLAVGPENILAHTARIFRALRKSKNCVFFFDEIDQLVISRRYEKDRDIWFTTDRGTWFTTALLPLFQDLHDNEDIIYIYIINK